ncbi:hypothetical protein [Sphingobacterium spiritivorum]|uniref:hypothetical protein n=1 Tax=Sphingobacterium spiritivorum TaxID=258 RepID=UPI0005871E31|nr:hypothetical protein [Sphingobacterium spiritivorum]
MNQIALKALHKKYLEGNCSVSEKQILLEILAITPDDQLMDFEEVLALTDPGVYIDEDISEAIYNKIVAAQPQKRSNPLFLWQRAVAAAIVFIALSVLASIFSGIMIISCLLIQTIRILLKKSRLVTKVQFFSDPEAH